MNRTAQAWLKLACCLLLLAGLAAVEVASVPAVSADASGCTFYPGEPALGDSGPECQGSTGSCYLCEHTSTSGGTMICAEAPDPEDGFYCVDAETLPGRRAQNQG
jgi:hypothetical protein